MSVSLHVQAAGNNVPGAPSSVPIALIPWTRLIGGLSAVEAIAKIGVVASDEAVDLWVVMRDEDDAAEAEVSRLEREYRVAVGSAPFELHVVALTLIDAANLPPFETILARQRASAPTAFPAGSVEPMSCQAPVGDVPS